jgi:hypothetical protein
VEEVEVEAEAEEAEAEAAAAEADSAAFGLEVFGLGTGEAMVRPARRRVREVRIGSCISMALLFGLGKCTDINVKI